MYMYQHAITFCSVFCLLFPLNYLLQGVVVKNPQHHVILQKIIVASLVIERSTQKYNISKEHRMTQHLLGNNIRIIFKSDFKKIIKKNMDMYSTVENYWRVQKRRKLNEIIYLQIQSPPNFFLGQI